MDDEWLRVEDVAALLRISTRQAARYAPRVRTRRDGRRILFARQDVETLASELHAEQRAPTAPRMDLMPAGEVIAAIDRRDAEIQRLTFELGRLQERVEAQQRFLADGDATRQELERVRAELARLQRRPWWKRLFDTDATT